MAKRALGPATLDLVRAIRATADPDRPWLVAVSGGRDSLSLAAAAQLARADAVRAVVVDHRLQPGSAQIAARAVSQLEERGLPTDLVRVSVTSAGGPEAAARTARHQALGRAAAVEGAQVLLGHTMDDQAETVLLAMARGSGIRSLAAMAPITHLTDPPVELVRPLLGIRRSRCAETCAELGLSWWDDPHNEDPRFLRSRIRTALMPQLADQLGDQVIANLARTAALAGADADLLDAQAAAAVAVDAAVLDCRQLAELATPIRSRVLLTWLRGRGGRDLSQTHVAAVEQLITRWHGQGPVDLPGVRVSRHDGGLHVDR